MMNFVSNSYNFIIKEALKLLLLGRYMTQWSCGLCALCQPGYSAEEKPGVILIFLCQ